MNESSPGIDLETIAHFSLAPAERMSAVYDLIDSYGGWCRPLSAPEADGIRNLLVAWC